MFRLFYRVVTGAFLVLLGLMGVSYLQKRFDDGDLRKALAVVRGRVTDLEKPEECAAEVVSRIKGDIRVRCGQRSWIVDVLGARIAEETQPTSP